jgi:5'-3' exonuclease
LSAFAEHYGSSNGKGIIEFEQAPTQADPCAAKDVIDSAVDAIISGDSDFPMYVGTSGIDRFGDSMIKDLKLSSRKGIAEAGKIVTGQKAVAKRVDDILGPHLNLESVFVGGAANVPRKYPMFDGVADPKAIALLAMAVGCDACPGGVDGIGPKKAMELYTRLKKQSIGSGAAR